MKNIAIIGVGALGMRHLQAMNELAEYNKLYAVEANPNRIAEMQDMFPNVVFYNDISFLPRELVAVVIATNANVRRNVFEQLVKERHVENIIFEKVLFQRFEDYDYVNDELNNRGINAWVNCVRREWNAYKQLKKNLSESKVIYFNAIGGQWGLGTSAIHMLDIIEFLSASQVENIDICGLDNDIYESKRKGFYEFDGTITGKAGRCREFSITSINNSLLPFSINIYTENASYRIDEMREVIYISEIGFEWEMREERFLKEYQSQITGRILKAIIDTGSCDLPDYYTSMILHIKYMKKLQKFFEINGMKGDICPIT